MKIAMFTDTYFPQVSGVASSIKVLRDELVANGHEVVIFTTTDPDAPEVEEGIVRMASIPFVFFTDRRMVIGGMYKAYKIAKEENFDLIHTHTEFGMGLIGKYVAYRLKIPTIHTYHTMYEKYLHYIANGHLVRPQHVKALSKYFCNQSNGIIAPGQTMRDILEGYTIKTPIRVIPTGVHIPPRNADLRQSMREQLGLQNSELVLLSLSRLAHEKSLDKLIAAMPEILETFPTTQLVFVGDGPARESLEKQVAKLDITNNVVFVGEINNDDVYRYYQMADIYVNASTTETQGLTYLESVVNGLPIIAFKNDYLGSIITTESLGKLYEDINELPKTIIEYATWLKNSKEAAVIDEKLLYPLSAEKFYYDVIDFYQDVIDHYTPSRQKSNNPKAGILNRLYFDNWDNRGEK